MGKPNKIHSPKAKLDQGQIQPEVEGGATCRMGAKNVGKSRRAKGVQKSLAFLWENFSGFSIE